MDLFEETFCYGNVEVLKKEILKFEENKLYGKLCTALKKSDTERGLESYWVLVTNVKKIKRISISVGYVDFIKNIFDVLDERFKPGRESVNDFYEPFMIKVFIIYDMMYSIYAQQNIVVSVRFEELFGDIISYIRNNRIITYYNYPTTADWIPIWKLEYNEHTVTSSIIDVYNDTILLHPTANQYTRGTLSNIVIRLKMLVKLAPRYIDFISGIGVINIFTKYIFYNYSYKDLVDNYMEFIDLFDDTFLPQDVNRLQFNLYRLKFELLPEQLASYILGYPSSIGILTRKQIRECCVKLEEGAHNDTIKNKNKEYINANMFFDNVVNIAEDENILNLLYVPVHHYNIDDIMVVLSNGVYFIFNCPEYENILSKQENPYSRKRLNNEILKKIGDLLDMKTIMIYSVRNRGLRITLNGTIEENQAEVIDGMCEYTEPVISPKSQLISLLFNNYQIN